MKENYEDIKSRIEDPVRWYDSNGTPRYDKFSPDLCPNIYANMVVLLDIECQYCHEAFAVEMHTSSWSDRGHPPKKWHYGDPPIHGCVGDTMNCEDNVVMEVWVQNGGKNILLGRWKRMAELEGPCEDWMKA